MMRPILALLIAASVFGQEKPPAGSLADRTRYEVAAAQRDYLLAKQQLDQAGAKLQKVTAEAEKACAAKDMAFDGAAVDCVEKKR